MSSPLTVEQFGEIMRALGQLQEGQRATLDRLDAQNVRLDGHDERLRKVESQWSKLLGAAAVISAVISYLPLPKL